MLGMGSQAFEAFLAAWEAYNEQGINMLDPNEGRDIVIERTGESFETKYSVTPWATPTQVDPEAMTKLFDIDAFIASELESGNRKGFAIAAAAVKGVIAGAGVGRTLIPARAASLIPASTPAAAPAAAAPVIDVSSRVIDPDEPPAWTDEQVEQMAADAVEPAPPPAPVPNPAVKAAIERARAAAPAPADAPASAAAAPAPMSEEPWKDDELNNLINSLK